MRQKIQLNDFHLKTGWILNVIWLLSLLSYKCLSTLDVMDCGHIDGWKAYCITLWRSPGEERICLMWGLWEIPTKASKHFSDILLQGECTFHVEAEAGFSKGVFVCTTLRFYCAQGAGSIWFLKGWYVCCQHRFHCVSQDFTGFHWKLILQSNWTFVWLAPNQLSECLVTRTLSDYIQWPYSPGYSYIEIISFGDISVCVTLLGRFKSLGMGAWD